MNKPMTDERLEELKGVTAHYSVGDAIRHAEFIGEIDCLREELRLARGAMNADDERLRKASARVGIPMSCDAAEELADHLLASRKYAKDLETKLARAAGLCLGD